MKKIILTTLLLTSASAFAAQAAAPKKLVVTLDGIYDGTPIPQKFAYCVADGKGKYSETGGNANPAITWSKGPKGTKSYALVVVDPDVPASFDSANQDGQTIAADFDRQNFYHWVLTDIPVEIHAISQGQDSNGITEGGKKPGKTAYGINGQNDYAAKAGQGAGGGYDGPCPPWNDERMHHYHFNVYALDVPSLNLSGNFTGQQAEEAMKGHILAQGKTVGTYSTNQKLLTK